MKPGVNLHRPNAHSPKRQEWQQRPQHSTSMASGSVDPQSNSPVLHALFIVGAEGGEGEGEGECGCARK